jgi:hypothetical protein
MTVKGQIEETKVAKSGKTLGVLVNGKWYRTKEFHLEHEVGSTIDFDVTTSSLPDGKPLYWIGDYHLTENEYAPPPDVPRETPPVAETTRREQARYPDDEAAAYQENAMLMRFIGQCFAGYPFQTTDEAHIRYRTQMLYRLGKDILSGKIADVETGPRKRPEPKPEHGIPGYSPAHKQGIGEESKQEGDFDDDFPF